MLTAKQERFAQLIGTTPDEYNWACYKLAYDADGSTIRVAGVEASRLLANPNIALRVKEIRRAASEHAEVTLGGHLADLADIKAMALEGDKTAAGHIVRNYGAAVAAEVARGKHSGVAAPDKHQDVTSDVPAGEAITELCTQNGVFNAPAHKAGVEMLRLLKTSTPQDVEPAPSVPKPSVPDQHAPDMVQ